LGYVTKANVDGCEPTNCSTGVGCGTSGPDAPAARRNSKNSAPVRVGNSGTEWPTMSVCLRRPLTSGRWKRMANPRGSASAVLSGMLGIPVELEKRTQTGVLAAVKCGALDSLDASAVGVKLPARSAPLA
jgi:hypothetical protein